MTETIIVVKLGGTEGRITSYNVCYTKLLRVVSLLRHRRGIDQLAELEPSDRVVDLACGNGVLGLAAWHAGLGLQILFCDESAMAIDSARTIV